MASIIDRIKHAWNAFVDKPTSSYSDGPGAYSRPDRRRLTSGNERSIINSVYNRIAVDISSIDIKHVRLDNRGRYAADIRSGLNNCLTLDTNIDQTARAFKIDMVMSMLDEGVVAVVPVDTSVRPINSNAYDIYSMRTGKITQWYRDKVEVELYNERLGDKSRLVLPKAMVAIIENPFYSTMNERSSIQQRLIRKLNILDAIDEQSGSGKLNMIIQLPYAVRGETRTQQAAERLEKIENQLVKSKYGIAYIDSTEHITQLNRSIENNLMGQIEYLQNMLFAQLGVTQSILDGTADEKTMLNYNTRIIEPIISAIADEFKRKFLSKTARTQGQSILFFRDPFKLVPVSQIADIADKFTRNEIMSSNEIRQVVGMTPSDDPAADELRNKNLNQSNEEINGQNFQNERYPEEYDEMTEDQYE